MAVVMVGRLKQYCLAGYQAMALMVKQRRGFIQEAADDLLNWVQINYCFGTNVLFRALYLSRISAEEG